jgi:fucokinase
MKALAGIFGLQISNQKIYDLVLLLEQLITTGGGWQDQVGGLENGIKLCCTKSGLLQDIRVSPLELSNQTIEELEERFVLVFTGQRRLARNLLREITGKYILNDEDVVFILNKIQHLAVLMRYELEKGNVDNFIALLNEHWELSKRLDSGSSNTFIDQIIEVCRPYIDGVLIAGAGGGGFLQFFLKKNCSKELLRKSLNEIYQSSGIEIWETKFVF